MDAQGGRPHDVPAEDRLLTIGELARRTGVAAPTLRMWESRHGFPEAVRLPSGHRRYEAHTVDQVGQVARLRDAGMRLELAVGQVLGGADVAAPSVFAVLRRQHPQLLPHRLRKSTLLALTWAMEDECVARAQQPWLFGAFQEERYYRQAEARWRDLARTSRGAWAFAGFSETRSDAPPAPVEVDLPAEVPMRREWSLVCQAPDFPAVLAAWELPGQDHRRDGDRVFESLWTLEPQPVADAARVCLGVAADRGHDISAASLALDVPMLPASAELRHAGTLFNRVLSYADRLR